MINILTHIGIIRWIINKVRYVRNISTCHLYRQTYTCTVQSHAEMLEHPCRGCYVLSQYRGTRLPLVHVFCHCAQLLIRRRKGQPRIRQFVPVLPFFCIIIKCAKKCFPNFLQLRRAALESREKTGERAIPGPTASSVGRGREAPRATAGSPGCPAIRARWAFRAHPA
jgi:hypothetical protein